MNDYIDGAVARWLLDDFERQGAVILAACEEEIFRRTCGGEQLEVVFPEVYRRAVQAVVALQSEFALRLDAAVEQTGRTNVTTRH